MRVILTLLTVIWLSLVSSSCKSKEVSKSIEDSVSGIHLTVEDTKVIVREVKDIVETHKASVDSIFVLAGTIKDDLNDIKEILTKKD